MKPSLLRLKNRKYLKNNVKVLMATYSRNLKAQRPRCTFCLYHTSCFFDSPVSLTLKQAKAPSVIFHRLKFGTAILGCLETYRMHMLNVLSVSLSWTPVQAGGWCWKAALKKTWRSWWKISWTWASNESLWQRRPTTSWTTLGGSLPAGQGQGSLLSI